MHRALSILTLCLLLHAEAALAAAPTANPDAYETLAGDNLSVDAPGVLDNDDDPDGDSLTAELVTDPASGGVANLGPDGSFEYEPPDGYVGTDTFTYRAFDGASYSAPATVSVTVSGSPGLAAFLDEAAFLNTLANQGFEATAESFEDDAIWGGVRSTIVDGSFTAPSITSLGITWAGNNPDSEVTTSNGAAYSGSWGFYELPHGSYLTGTDCHLPGNCTDGFVATASPTLYAVGGWIRGFHGSKVHFVLDDERVIDFDDAILTTGSRFLGVIDPGGFRSFEVRELEGTNDDAKYIWADLFTFGTLPGITLTVLPGPGPGGVTLQWLGGQPGFRVFRSMDAATVTDPVNELGQTAARWWNDVPPPGQIYFYRVITP